VTTCRSCGAEVVFVPSETTGRRMILDARPSKAVLLIWDDAGTFGDRLGEGDYRAGTQVARVVDVYTDHHATCPDAAAWEGKAR
jgi:hypothetical protein